MKNVAIIGAGLQGKRRYQAILDDPHYQITHVVDLDIQAAKHIAKMTGGEVSTDWRKVVSRPDVDVVCVLTYPDSHAEISIDAMNAGKDVLCEKPLTRTVSEARELVAVAHKTGRILKCGFNHRHHPAILEAYKLFQKGTIGKALFGRGRYGIQGREGIEKEWRSNPQIVSGGQLMEQGIHLVDLFCWFLGDMREVTGMMSTSHWPIAPLEDNGFLLMKNNNNIIVNIHSSLTQWINLFEFEIYGEKGSLSVQGLGATYGVEKLTISLMDPNGPFSYQTIEYRGGDKSWASEWKEFTQAIEKKSSPLGNGEDGLRAMELVMAGYESSQSGKTVFVRSDR